MKGINQDIKQDIKIIIIGNVCSGKTTLAKIIQKEFEWNFYSIDSLRNQYSDGTIAGDYCAYEKFLRHLQAEPPCILEFSGASIHKHTIRTAISLYKIPYILIYVKIPIDLIKERLQKREMVVPAPSMNNIYESVEINQTELDNDISKKSWEIPGSPHEILKFSLENVEDLSKLDNNFSSFKNLIIDIQVFRSKMTGKK